MKVNTHQTRITKLSDSDISQLQEMSKSYGLLRHFWVNIEHSLSEANPPLELHKCSCGLLVLVTRGYVEKATLKHRLDRDSECWHKKGFEKSQLSEDLLVTRLVERVSVLLRENKKSEAYIEGAQLLPISNENCFDYGLWRLQQVIMTQDYDKSSSVAKKSNFDMHYSKMVEGLMVIAERKNPSHLRILVKNYISDPNIMPAFEKGIFKVFDAENILEQEAYRRVTNLYTPSQTIATDSVELASIRYWHNTVDAYQDFFEITPTLEFLYNLIKISQGGSYATKPFTNLKVMLFGKNQPVKNNKRKMLEAICSICSSTSVASMIRRAYDYELRNGTSGHNDYSIDLKRKIIRVNSTQKAYSFNYVEEKKRRIKSLSDAIILHAHMYSHEVPESSALLGRTGIESFVYHFDEKTKLPVPFITIAQFWSNASHNFEGNLFDLILFFPWKIGEHEVFVFSTSKTIPMPGTFMGPYGKNIYKWLQEAIKHDTLKLRRLVIAPRCTYFAKLAKGEYEDEIGKFYIIGSTEHEVPLDKEGIAKLIERMGNSQLAEEAVIKHTPITNQLTLNINE